MRRLPDLAALAERLPPNPRTRFAPSPTGYLHLGHVVNAIYTWGLAQALGGRVLLRIEDHDRERSRAVYERAIVDDLGWLGLEPDERAGTVRQSEREAIYARALAALDAHELVYACACSRKQIEAASARGVAARASNRVGGDGAIDVSSGLGLATPDFAEERRYPGTCRERRITRAPGTGLRVRMEPGTECFEDALFGVLRQEPSSQCGDVLIRDRVGQWTYQFAVAVDDTEQQIDLVIRGADLLASTARQLRLARLLGRELPPVFAHHRLLVGDTGLKLSKSNGDTGIRELRGRGLSAPDVLGLAAARAGLLLQPRPLDATDLGSTLERIAQASS
jgi:glutamyl-Q tRNA(Asp) synthetase